jgi:2-haloalkanoic acid dehalogenase type II
MTIKALNLDFYGTFTDWLTIWVDVSQKIIDDNKLGVSAKDLAVEWRTLQRKDLDVKEFTPYKENISNALRLLCDKYNIENKGYDRLIFSKWHEIEPFPEVGAVLQKLKGKVVLAICSNSSRDFFNACAAKLPVQFDYVFISDETQVNKPWPKMYETALAGMGVSKDEVLHVASSQMDLTGATNAGLQVCWINRRKQKRLSGTPEPAYEIYELTELLDIV